MTKVIAVILLFPNCSYCMNIVILKYDKIGNKRDIKF